MKVSTTVISTSLGQARLPVPDHRIRVCERFGLSVRASLDRRPNHEVADGTPTHTLLMVERTVRHHEAELVRRSDALIHTIDVRLASLAYSSKDNVEADAEAPRLSETGSTPGERSAWAAGVRATRVANQQFASRRAAAKHAAEAYEALRAERDRVVIETHDARKRWREGYVERAAFYTRARRGWFRRLATVTPAIPDYHFADGPSTLANQGDTPSVLRHEPTRN